MNYRELDEVVADLEAVETFVCEIAVNKKEIADLGSWIIAAWPSYKNVISILRNFDVRISELLEFARAVDRTTWESIRSIIESSKLPDSLGKIYVHVRLQIEKKHRRSMLREFLLLLSSYVGYSVGSRPNLFSEGAIPIQEILVALHRLVPQVRKLEKLYLSKRSIDDEIFKPFNIDRAVVIEHIESALLIIQNASLSSDNKKQLLEYLEHTKIELAEANPSWKKIVGALVIVATLLSGLADAPQAYDNISKAIQHILGTSVEQHLPRQLPALPDATGGVLV